MERSDLERCLVAAGRVHRRAVPVPIGVWVPGAVGVAELDHCPDNRLARLVDNSTVNACRRAECQLGDDRFIGEEDQAGLRRAEVGRGGARPVGLDLVPGEGAARGRAGDFEPPLGRLRDRAGGGRQDRQREVGQDEPAVGPGGSPAEDDVAGASPVGVGDDERGAGDGPSLRVEGPPHDRDRVHARGGRAAGLRRRVRRGLLLGRGGWRRDRGIRPPRRCVESAHPGGPGEGHETCRRQSQAHHPCLDHGPPSQRTTGQRRG